MAVATDASIKAALAALQNPVSMRQAILNRLHISPTQLTGMTAGPEFDATVNDLYRTGAQTGTKLTANENDIRRQYTQNYAQAQVDQKRAIQSVIDNMAGRGLYYSGANLNAQGDVNTEYNKYYGNLAQAQSQGLQDIANQRQNLYDTLTRGRTTAESAYGQSVADWMKQQATAAWVAEQNKIDQQRLLAALRPQPSVTNVTNNITNPGLPTPPAVPAPARATVPAIPKPTAPKVRLPKPTGGSGFSTGYKGPQ